MSLDVSQHPCSLGQLQHFSERRGEPAWLWQQRQDAWQQMAQMRPAEWHHDPPPFSWHNLRWTDAPGLGVWGRPVVRATPALMATAGLVATDLLGAVRSHADQVQACLFAAALPLHAPALDDPYAVALQAGLWQDGLFIHVPAGVRLSSPLRVVRQLDPSPRSQADGPPDLPVGYLPVQAEHTLLVLDEGAELDLIWEDWVDRGVSGQAPEPGAGCVGMPTDTTQRETATGGIGLLSQSWEVHLGPGARLRAAFLQDLPAAVYARRIGRLVLERDSNLELVAAEVGAAWARTSWSAELTGSGANVKAYGLFLGTSQQQLDLELATHNRADHTQAEMWGRGVLADQARGVFRGLGYVHQDAPGSSNHQQTAALVLSKSARADVVPSLKIDEDEVQAGHGATIGQVDEEVLFYLMSRGLSRGQATRLLVEGFLASWWERIALGEAVATVREHGLAKLGEKE